MLRKFMRRAVPIVLFLSLVGPVYAQESVEEPAVIEVTVQEADTPVNVEVDTGDLITELEDAAQSAEVVLAVIAMLVITLMKYLAPTVKLETRQIAIGVFAVFSFVFLIANATGYVEQFNRGVDLAAIIAEPLRVILMMIFGSTGLYKLSKGLGVPVLGDAQGEKALSLAPHTKG